MKELWKGIPDFEMYEVSNLGHVRNIKTGKILKPIEDVYGYLTVGLYNDDCIVVHYDNKLIKRPKKKKIHSLVAAAFCEKPDSTLDLVPDHIDQDKHNNRADNLRWATHRENRLNATNRGIIVYRYADPIVLMKDGEIVARFDSCADASKKVNLTIQSIANNILGRRKGFKIGEFFLEKNLT